MNSEEFGSSHCDLESLLQDQSTQTSNTVSHDKTSKPPNKIGRPPLPRDLNKSDKGSITVFEYCHILQDPEKPHDVTIIKETVTEEIKPHNTSNRDKSTTSIEEATANRYKYCREVIKPYMKHSEECPESEEELLKNALHSVSEDFPDYQPCFDTTGSVKDNLSDDTTSPKSLPKRIVSNNICKVDASTSCRANMDEKKKHTITDEKKCIKISESSENISKPAGNDTPKCPKPIEQCKEPVRDPSPKPKCMRKKSAESTRKCSPKPSSPNCDLEPGIGIKCTQPSYYLIDKCKDTNSIPNIPEPVNSRPFNLDTHNKAMSTIKIAMEDFVGKVYNTTKDAVTLIATESAKQLDRVKQTMTSESSSTDDTKKCENKFSSFNFFKKVDGADFPENSSKREVSKISDVISNIMLKVDSTLSMLSDRMSYDNIPQSFKPSNFNDMSSPYDKPLPPITANELSTFAPTAPTPVPLSNSMFATIKDKIVSMFYEGEPKPTESVSQSSSNSSSSHPAPVDNEEDLINRIID